MKQKTLIRFYSASLLVVFLIGSVSWNSPKAETADHPQLAKVIKASVAQDVTFIADAVPVVIPINKIGFHSFVYQDNEKLVSPVIPVAHAPPK